MRDLGLRLADLRVQNLQLSLGHVLLVHGQLVGSLRVVECGHRHHTFLRHSLGAFVASLERRHIRAFSIDFGAFHVGLGCAQAGFGSFLLCLGLRDMGLDLFFVELGQHLTSLHAIARVDKQLFHDSTGLRFDLDLGDGLDLPGRHHALGQIAAFHLRQLGRINLGAAARCRDQASHRDQNNGNADAHV